jgi:hypothetical protein
MPQAVQIDFYPYNRDEFLTHYHKRSNSESTFSMIKAKSGARIRSKTPTAQINEANVTFRELLTAKRTEYQSFQDMLDNLKV